MSWKTVLTPLVLAAGAFGASVTTLIGTGTGGYSDTQVNNPYGMAI